MARTTRTQHDDSPRSLGGICYAPVNRSVCNGDYIVLDFNVFIGGKMIPNREEDRDGWLAYRKEKILIGSSDISTIVGLNKYNSPLQLYHHFTTVSGQATEENDYMWLGKQMEPVILALFARTRPDLAPVGNDETITDDWRIATADGYTNDDGLIEIKCTRADFEIWQTGVPDYAHCQVIWQMGIAKKNHAYVVAMLAGNPDLAIHRVEFDPDIYQAMIETAELFRESVRTKTPPAPNHLDGKIIDALVDVRVGEIEITDPEMIEEAKRYHFLLEQKKEINANLKTLDEELKTSENKLKVALKDKAIGHIGQFEIKVDTVFRKAYTQFKFKNKED